MKNKTKKLLLVEDEDSIIYALTGKFDLNPKIKVLCAKNGEQGLEMTLREKPDLILLDIILPKVNGIEMLQKLRQDDWGKNAKVIILSNLSSTDKEREASKLGVKDYIIKADSKIDDVVKLVQKNLHI